MFAGSGKFGSARTKLDNFRIAEVGCFGRGTVLNLVHSADVDLMGFRFQRRIKIFPGVHLNLSKSGVGFSAGVRGFHVGVDAKGRRYTSAGLPGTGISWREYHKKAEQPSHHITSPNVPPTIRCAACGAVHQGPPALCSKCGYSPMMALPGSMAKRNSTRIAWFIVLAVIAGIVIISALARGAAL